jgi:Kef-type K+ transport system membrane component KefB
MERLSELGVLFLLFEMGLELSLDRLKSLAKYAFGMGSLQVRAAALSARVGASVGGREVGASTPVC